MDNISELQIGIAGEHLVCADLIMKGYVAFLSDQGLPFDVVVFHNGNLIKVQVKTTTKTRSDHNGTELYRFFIRRGKGNKKEYNSTEIDCMAFVALDLKEIAYLPFSTIKQTMEFKSPILEYRSKIGKYINKCDFNIEDYVGESVNDKGA